MKTEQTKIQWANFTFNPWRGCTKISEGCANCYAEVLSRRNPATLGEWGPGRPRVLAKLKAFLTHPDAILLTRTNDRALVPMVLHALWCQKLEKEMPELITTGPGVEVARRALEPRIEAITKHFATGKDQA